MNSTGIVRKLDVLGRIVLPKEMRDFLGLQVKESLEIYMDEDTIILKKYKPGCSCCGESNEITSIYGVNLCPSCLEEFNKPRKKLIKVKK